MGRKKIVCQTGRKVKLSDQRVNYTLSKAKTVRYQYRKVGGCWLAWVCGPFHSRTYGVCGMGGRKATAKQNLVIRLANDYGYTGHLMYSDVDESDTVGNVDPRLLDENASARPITTHELIGAVGI